MQGSFAGNDTKGLQEQVHVLCTELVSLFLLDFGLKGVGVFNLGVLLSTFYLHPELWAKSVKLHHFFYISFHVMIVSILIVTFSTSSPSGMQEKSDSTSV